MFSGRVKLFYHHCIVQVVKFTPVVVYHSIYRDWSVSAGKLSFIAIGFSYSTTSSTWIRHSTYSLCQQLLVDLGLSSTIKNNCYHIITEITNYHDYDRIPSTWNRTRIRHRRLRRRRHEERPSTTIRFDRFLSSFSCFSFQIFLISYSAWNHQ